MVAVGFTSAEALERVLGPGYVVLPLAGRVLGELAVVRGVVEVQVDPVFAAAPVSRMDPQVVGVLAVCAVAGAAAALLGELR